MLMAMCVPKVVDCENSVLQCTRESGLGLRSYVSHFLLKIRHAEHISVVDTRLY